MGGTGKTLGIGARGSIGVLLCIARLGCGGDAARPPSNPTIDGPPFSSGAGFVSAVHPIDVAVADLDGDGRNEVAVLEMGDSERELAGGVTILRDGGDGQLEPSVRVAVGGTPVALAMGDWNRDGRIDLATADVDGGRVSVLTADGAGGFAVSTHQAGVRPTAMAAGDVDGDGLPDLVVANPTASDARSIGLLRNLGAAGFAAPVTIDGGRSPVALALGDLDEDGLPDLVVCPGPGERRVNVLMNEGEGRFAPAMGLPFIGDPERVQLADINGDGHADMLIATPSGMNVDILLGDGRGTFAYASDIFLGGSIAATALGDTTGDGKPELAIAGGADGSVATLFNFGNGFFSVPISYAVGSSVSAVAIGDVDHDSVPDLVVADAGMPAGDETGAVRVFLGRGGRYEAPVQYRGASTAVLAEITGDELPDLVTIHAYGLALVWPGAGDGSFSAVPIVNESGVQAEAMAVADLDGDGDGDLVVASIVGGVVTVLNDGEGGLSKTVTMIEDVGAKSLLVADVDRNGRPDLVFATEGELGVALNDGKGGFAPATYHRVGFNVLAAAVGDVNGDGWVDLLSSSGVGSLVDFRLGDGAGAFAGPQPVKTGGPVSGLALADLDGDGMNDIVAVTSNDLDELGVPAAPRLSVMFNDGRSGFRDPIKYAADGASGALIAEDLDGDGAPDVAWAQQDRGRVGLMLNDRRGKLAAQRPLLIGGGPFALTSGDIDRDGRPDLAVSTATGVTVLVNQSRGLPVALRSQSR